MASIDSKQLNIGRRHLTNEQKKAGYHKFREVGEVQKLVGVGSR